MHNALIITDGHAGNLRQARALARAAGVADAEVVIDLRTPWRELAPRWPHLASLAVRDTTRLPTQAPWPRLVIGCGRQAAWVTRWLRREARGASYCVQILDPRLSPNHWDLVIAPRHDGLHGKNVITPIGSLNPVDSGWLAAARSEFAYLARLPQPRLSVMLGGARRGLPFDQHLGEVLIESVRALHARHGGSVLLCASPRTPEDFARSVRQGLHDLIADAWLTPADGRNPYPGHLAWADRILVTPDSVNMLSEAAATGAPLHTLSSLPLPERLKAFHDALLEGRWLNALDDDGNAAEQPLRETAPVASELRRRMQTHFS